MFDFLAITWNVDPELFAIGPFHFRYYGILFMAGFALGYYMFIKFYQREGLPVTLLDPLFWLLIGCTLVGSRLGHVLFYQPDYYLANPVEILKVWEGGLASHGGTIGIMIGMAWYIKKYGRKYNFDYIWLLDHLAIAVCFAACFIRLGNLMNSEIYGNETDLPWGFIFTLRGEVVPKHPTQLYEALCYLGTGVLLKGLYHYALDKMKKGWFLGIFFIGIFGTRFLIEFIKEPQVAFEQGMTLNMGQLLSIPFVLMGIGLLVWGAIKREPAKRVELQKKNGRV